MVVGTVPYRGSHLRREGATSSTAHRKSESLGKCPQFRTNQFVFRPLNPEYDEKTLVPYFSIKWGGRLRRIASL